MRWRRIDMKKGRRNYRARKSSPQQEIVMQMFRAFITLILMSNAMILVALIFLRRARPGLRTRLFGWALHNGAHRRSAKQRQSGIPA